MGLLCKNLVGRFRRLEAMPGHEMNKLNSTGQGETGMLMGANETGTRAVDAMEAVRKGRVDHDGVGHGLPPGNGARRASRICSLLADMTKPMRSSACAPLGVSMLRTSKRDSSMAAASLISSSAR